MADNHTPSQRSYNMSRVRNNGTKPEEKVRKYLFSQGFRYRKNVRKLPGCPDIVLSKYRTVIFVHGCFWHVHQCERFKWPASNESFWKEKLQQNVERDRINQDKLRADGWNVIVVWECEIKKCFESVMNPVVVSLQTRVALKNANERSRYET